MASGGHRRHRQPLQRRHQLPAPVLPGAGRGVSVQRRDGRVSFSTLLLLLLLFLNRGSAAANAISQFIQALVLFVYICVMGLHKATWDGEPLFLSLP